MPEELIAELDNELKEVKNAVELARKSLKGLTQGVYLTYATLLRPPMHSLT